MLCIFFELWIWLCSNVATQSREETGTDSSTRQSPPNEGLYQNLSSQKQHSVRSELQKSPHVSYDFKEYHPYINSVISRNARQIRPEVLISWHTEQWSIIADIYLSDWSLHMDTEEMLFRFLFPVILDNILYKYRYIARAPSVKARKQQKNVVWLEQVIEVMD